MHEQFPASRFTRSNGSKISFYGIVLSPRNILPYILTALSVSGADSLNLGPENIFCLRLLWRRRWIIYPANCFAMWFSRKNHGNHKQKFSPVEVLVVSQAPSYFEACFVCHVLQVLHWSFNELVELSQGKHETRTQAQCEPQFTWIFVVVYFSNVFGRKKKRPKQSQMTKEKPDEFLC